MSDGFSQPELPIWRRGAQISQCYPVVAGSRDMLGWGDFLKLDVLAGTAAEMSKKKRRATYSRQDSRFHGAAGSEHDPIPSSPLENEVFKPFFRQPATTTTGKIVGIFPRFRCSHVNISV